ncbi:MULTISPECIES: metallopeptidase family protein [Paenarthrobacter]|uniref:metallopeptidase family protein n=1 Tax=Paenarthrobacter TaxID=1742992 RepID=UPI001BA7D048|nr:MULTISPECIES: metallopeptidase family protein [Paenarthrobacter]MDR6637561.1 putative Zn-dependent protease with MMP-like domain [Paenarthrobacter nitroguajacolicus]WOH19944.1 metallopeptidase family protein [Paenarthrobacter sp. GOM3]
MQSQPHIPGFTIRWTDADGDQAGEHAGTGGRSFRRRRRNRHGRGLRGELMLANLPGFRTRSERFDDMVLDSAERLQDMWGKQLDGVLFAVDEIPPDLEQLVATGGTAPMGSYTPGGRGEAPMITIYRRVVVQGANTREELQDLVHDVVVEYTAEMLGVPPETLDPVYRRRYQ